MPDKRHQWKNMSMLASMANEEENREDDNRHNGTVNAETKKAHEDTKNYDTAKSN